MFSSALRFAIFDPSIVTCHSIRFMTKLIVSHYIYRKLHGGQLQKLNNLHWADNLWDKMICKYLVLLLLRAVNGT